MYTSIYLIDNRICLKKKYASLIFFSQIEYRFFTYYTSCYKSNYMLYDEICTCYKSNYIVFDLKSYYKVCVLYWRTKEGKVSVVKEMVEDIDKEKKKISFRVIEGELLQHYKSFKIMIQLTPKQKGSTVHCVFEYQKQKDHIPDPHAILQITLDINNKINAYLTHNHN